MDGPPSRSIQPVPSADDHLRRALDLLRAGRADQAAWILADLTRSSPRRADAHATLGRALLASGRAAESIESFGRAIRLAPGDAASHAGLAEARRAAGDVDASIASFERAAALEGDARARAGYRVMLAQTFILARRYPDALGAACSARDHLPDDPACAACLGLALLNLGHADEALEAYAPLRATLAREPAFAAAVANASLYAERPTPADVLLAHEAYGSLIEQAADAAHAPAPPAPSPSDGPLRVGFLSPDFRRHAVACFAEPLIERLRDLGRTRDAGLSRGVWLGLYMTGAAEDDVTGRFRALADSFVTAAGVPATALAQRIRRDRLHVLVDLAGLSVGHRADALALAPAPIQITYCGYPFATGLSRVARRVGDSTTDPPGDAASSLVERLDPCHLVFRPLALPDLDAPPRDATGVTFASFSTPMKIGPGVVALWSRVLGRVPHADLLLLTGAYRDRATREYLRDRFTRAGVDPARVRVEGPPPDAHNLLAHYRRVDIALDTFPYSGTTTVCESLAMGVPVVALRGDRPQARMSESILSACDLGNWVAPDPDAYVDLAASLAANPHGLRAGRAGLRARFLASPLRDEQGLARRFAAMLLRLAAVADHTLPTTTYPRP